jgi:hypothetical protein
MNKRCRGMEYLPLQNYLKNLTESRVILSYDEMEMVLHERLPDYAYKYQTWWVNSRIAGSHATTWLNGGYETANLHLGEWVEFIKINQTID